jgi:hypothetical protein
MPIHRPYANGPLPSVTQVLGMLSVPGLPWGAAKETALYAAHHSDQWMDLPIGDAVNKLYRHHRGVWDHRALLGTAVHRVNAEWCAGKEVRVLDIVQEMRDESPLWRRVAEAEIYADLLPMTDGLAKAWLAIRPEILTYEQVVRYPHEHLGYVGTYDWRCDIAGQVVLIDLKTTGKVKPGTAKYWDTWRLQLAAYRGATESVHYDDTGVEYKALPLPPVDACAVLHIYRSGDWQLDGVQAGPEEHEVFLALRKAYGWRQQADSPGREAPVIVGSPA